MSDTATRYSGLAKIHIRYHENSNSYTARVSCPDGAKTLKGIRLSPHDSRNISADGAEAFDKIAHAALSFAEYEGLESCGDTTGSGWKVSRTRPSSRIPRVPKGVSRRKS